MWGSWTPTAHKPGGSCLGHDNPSAHPCRDLGGRESVCTAHSGTPSRGKHSSLHMGMGAHPKAGTCDTMLRGYG